MPQRRDFLRMSVGGIGAAIFATSSEDQTIPSSSVSLRDIETVREGSILCRDVNAILFNGRKIEGVTAFNVKEGWVDAYRLPISRPIVHERHYGTVSYRLKGS